MHNLRTCAGAILCALIVAIATTPADARRHPNGHDCISPKMSRSHVKIEHRHYATIMWTCARLRSAGAPDEISSRRRRYARAATSSLITIGTAGGSITVAASQADKFRGFIADVVARGFRGPINCYARGGHVRGSLHYRGEACDFAQRGWNRTHRLMYRVADIAAKWGLRDGCKFGDCGHIDTGARLARGSGKRLLARWPVTLEDHKR